MTIDETVDREKLLDNFPVSDVELDRLIAFYNAFVTKSDETNGAPPITLSQLCRHVEQHHNALAVNVSKNGIHPTTTWLSALPLVEEVILPELSSPRQWFHKATKFVSPLLPHGVTEEDEESSPMYKAFYFLEAMVSLLGRRGNRFLPNFVYDTVMGQSNSNNNNNTGDQVAAADALVDLMYRHVQAAIHLQEYAQANHGNAPSIPKKKKQEILLEPPKAWVLSLREAATAGGPNNNNDGGGGVSRASWTEWVNNTIPGAMRGISTFYHYILFSPEHPFGRTSPSFALPQPDQENLFWNHQSDLLPLSLGCMSSVFGGSWYRLYSSNFDGLSFLMFQNSLLGYKGPTVMMIRRKGTNRNGVFGFYTDCPWREGNTWFGGDSYDSFLFKLDRGLGLYWPTYDTNGHYMYLNASTKHQNKLQGLAIGGIAGDTPRVHLTSSFEQCQATSTDTTYTAGPLVDSEEENGIAPPFFDVEAIEVWAVNVATKTEFLNNLQAGQKRLDSKEMTRQRAAHVDRAQFLDDFRSGATMNKLFCHREEARGRHDFVAANKPQSGYFVESKPPSTKLLRRKESSFSSDAGMDDSERLLF